VSRRKPKTLAARVLDARYRLVGRLGVRVRWVISIACLLAAVVILTGVFLEPARFDGRVWIVADVVLFLIILTISPRPFGAAAVGSPVSAAVTSSFELMAEYANLARRRGRAAIIATLERTRSRPGREILAFLASDGRYDLAALRSSLETFRDPGLRSVSMSALRTIHIGWALELARIMVIQATSAQETLDAATLYESIVTRGGLGRLSREHQQLFVEALLDSDLVARARAVAATWTDPTELESRLVADSVNPFLGRGDEGEGVDGWLRLVNAGFVSVGLEPVRLTPGNHGPLDRLGCDPVDYRDDPHRVTVVITSYRPDHTLITAVSSALGSSWRNLEILVVDDASGEEFAALYQQVLALDDRVRVERLTVNQGTYAGRNYALTVATGVFVTFHDSDDWMHPRRLELQATHLLANPEVAANASTSIRVTGDLGFSHHRWLTAKICEPSIMIRREVVVGRIGYFDLVRKNGDSEYRRRLQAAFGAPVPVLGAVPMTWQRTVPGSLSFTDVGRNWISPARRAYMNCSAAWHARISAGDADPYLERATTRVAPFYSPPELTDSTPRHSAFDVIFMSNWLVDGSHGGSQRSNEEEIRALRRAGLRVGVANIEAFWFMHKRDSRLSDRIVSMLNSGEVELVQLDSLTTTELLIIRYPPVLQFAAAVPSTIVAARVLIVANQGPYELDGTGRRYDIESCSQRVKTMFGREPVWAPQGPLVRTVLTQLVAHSNLLAHDVPAIVDPVTWRVSRRTLRGRQPVVGRYSRDIAAKWPEVADDLLAAYSSPRFTTKLMGGPETLTNVMGEPGGWPERWTVLAEGEVDTRAFLADIDFFVYFHASYYREAFGRSIVEAMASGLVVVLQSSFRPVFGDAAVYCEPHEVEEVVMALSSNQQAYDAQVERGIDFVTLRSSYDSYSSLIGSLLTAPSSSERVAVLTGLDSGGGA
jgi:glycosyltransferase involved in cell wall biosynthesis